MRRINRREFIRVAAGSAAGLGLMKLLGPQIVEVLGQVAEGNPPVIWIQGASCTGCSVSLLNSVDPPIADVLLKVISLKYHPTIMAAAGEQALSALEQAASSYKGKFFLVVEGGVPTKDEGRYCLIGEQPGGGGFGCSRGGELTFLDEVRTLGEASQAVIAVGSCAAYGGIPAAAPNPTGVVGVKEIVKKKPVINIPNCPAHPDRILGTLTYVLSYGELPELDALGRPKMFYPRPVHDNCPRREDFFAERFASQLGQGGCLYQVGCKGITAYSDCPERGWNNNTNWCVKAGAPCLACSEPGFPDESSPFYKKFWPDHREAEAKGQEIAARWGQEAGVTVAAAGLGAYLLKEALGK